jgi:hypothetical protein
MAVLALTSAKGAPGVSTAALAMTLLWPRAALLAECDPAGGSSILAGYLRGTVEHTRGLLPLALAQRHHANTGQTGLVGLEQELWAQTVPLTGDPGATSRAGAGCAGAGGRWLLPGLSDAAQAPSSAPLWGPLGALLANLEQAGTDVIVDAGRLGVAHAPTAVLRHADLVLLVMRSSLTAVAAVKARLTVLRVDLSVPDSTAPAGPLPPQQRGPLDGQLPHVALLLVGQGRPYSAKEISAACGVPVLTCLAWDPASADVLSAGAAPGRRFASSPLVRSTRAAISASTELIHQHQGRHQHLAPPTPPTPAAPSIAERLLSRESAR